MILLIYSIYLLLLFVSFDFVIRRISPIVSLLVPLDASDAVRRFVEALFITHCQTNLNTSGHLIPFEQNNNDTVSASQTLSVEEAKRFERGEWCCSLFQRFH